MTREEFVERCSQHWHKLDDGLEPFDLENNNCFCDAFTVAKDLRGNWTALRASQDISKTFLQMYQQAGETIIYNISQSEELNP